MAVDWTGWAPFDKAPGRPLADLDRPDAEAYFDSLMEARAERRERLVDLLGRNGRRIGISDEGIQTLNDWYSDNVESDEDGDRLAARWYAVGLDVGLFLGAAIIDRAPTVGWRLFTQGRTDASYHRPVLMGFRRVSNPMYNVDPETGRGARPSPCGPRS